MYVVHAIIALLCTPYTCREGRGSTRRKLAMNRLSARPSRLIPTRSNTTAAPVPDQDTATKRVPMDSMRKTSLTAGVFYLLTFVSIPTLVLYSAVHEPGYILGAGPDTAVIVGAILEIIVALAGIGTAVVLFPVLKRRNEGVALGFVGVRALEAATIFAGVACLLAVVTLRQAGVGPDAAVTGQALVALYDRAFLISQSLLPAANAVLLGSLLYQTRLVPRVLPMLGFVGAALLVASTTSVMFGLIDPISAWSAVAGLTIATWEFSLGVYLVVKGFRPSAVADLDTPRTGIHPEPVAA